MADWKEYESQIYEKLVSQFPNFQIKFDEIVRGRYSRVDRQIDVSIRTKVTFKQVFGVVDCKCYSDQ